MFKFSCMLSSVHRLINLEKCGGNNFQTKLVCKKYLIGTHEDHDRKWSRNFGLTLSRTRACISFKKCSREFLKTIVLHSVWIAIILDFGHHVRPENIDYVFTRFIDRWCCDRRLPFSSLSCKCLHSMKSVYSIINARFVSVGSGFPNFPSACRKNFIKM